MRRNRITLLFTPLLAAVLAANAPARDLGSLGCLIEPNAVIDLSTREEGVIDSILVARGDTVAIGQPLVELDAEVEQATVDLAEARAQMVAELQERREEVNLARRELERIDNLFEKKAISFTEKDRAETETRSARLRLQQTQQRQRVARLELERARKVLERRTLHSPVAGIVIERLLSPGESVENATILRIAEVDPLKIAVILPVERFGAVQAGQKADISPQFPGARPEIATVSVVDAVVDSASDTFRVQLKLANPDHRVPAGVRCGIAFRAAVEDEAGPKR